MYDDREESARHQQQAALPGRTSLLLSDQRQSLAVHLPMEWRLGVGGAWWFIGRFVAFRSKGRGSNPALAVMCGHWASPSLAVSCCASTRNSDTVSVLCRVRL